MVEMMQRFVFVSAMLVVLVPLAILLGAVIGLFLIEAPLLGVAMFGGLVLYALVMDV